jgi:2-methylcitrate dehydratase
MTAIAIKERRIGPEQFKAEKFTDPVIQELIDKITVESDPSMSVKSFQGSSDIVTKDGRHFQKRIDTPHGLGEDPLSDQELEDKFREMASKYMGERQIHMIFDTIWNLEGLEDMGDLTRMMIFEGNKP